MKKQILLLGVLASGLAYSQIGRVGVNTENPRATFEVKPTTANALETATTNEGILIPRVSRERLNNIATANLVDGTMVYVDDIIAVATDTTTEVTSYGFYYYDSSLKKWTKMATKYDQDLRMVGRYNHITQDAGVGSNGTNAGTGSHNIALGEGSLASITTGSDNIAIGDDVLYRNTTGSVNIAIGYKSMINNTSGGSNIALGNQVLTDNTTGGYNIALGYMALLKNTIGADNIALGSKALLNNTTGNYSIALGYMALSKNTTGANNIAIGSSALSLNVTGNDNIALGHSAMENSTAGRNNIALGSMSLYSNTTGNDNIALGHSAMENSTTGRNNIALGSMSLYSNTTGNNNIALGSYSLQQNKTGVNNIGLGNNSLRTNTIGQNNIALGSGSLYSNTDGNNNIGLGNNSLNRNTTGSGNIALSSSVLLSNTTGSNNVGMGLNSLRNNTTGINNVGTGVSTLFSNTTGNQNMAYGTETLYRNTTGQYNVGFGYRAMYNNVGGDSNVALGGNQSGQWIKGNNNVHIGNGLFHSASTSELDNVIAIGNGLSATEINTSTSQDNTIILGYKNGHNFSPKVGIGTYKPTEKVHIVANGPAIRIEDTNQAAGRVLTSDANGVGTWKPVAVSMIHGVFTGAGVNIPYDKKDYVYTGTYVAIPPASKYLVTVSALMTLTDNNESTGNIWLRTRFVEDPNDTAVVYYSGKQTTISGNLSAGEKYAILQGSVILENTSTTNYKLFYYQAGEVDARGTTQTLKNFGGNAWREGSIVAMPIQ